jgi:hypothetical protein
MEEDTVLDVFSEEADWLLVRVRGGAQTLGFVPRTYCEPLDASREVEVPDAAEAEADLEAQRAQEAAEARQRETAERQRQLKLKDKVETWSVSELEGKKKKKGTLGVGNGAVFFASDTDKVGAMQGRADAVARQAVPDYGSRVGHAVGLERDPPKLFDAARAPAHTLRWKRAGDIGQARDVERGRG